jgi:hypothetical protein
MQVLGTESFLTTPDVNGQLVMLNGGGTGTVTYGTLAARPAASTSGNLYVDTTSNYIWRDTGAAWVQLSTGNVLQVVTGAIPATSGTTTIPLDNTTPLVSEGWQIWSQSFTPISAASRIKIEFTIMSASSITTTTAANILALFAGSTNIGTTANRVQPSSANTPFCMALTVVYSPGSTAAITFSARLGGSIASTSYCNQTSAVTFGGASATEYIITEIL